MYLKKKVLCVFTGHGPEDIRMLGGTAKWRLNTDLLLQSCNYVVCVFNGAAQLPFAHGNPSARDNAAFLIGRIAGVEPVQEGAANRAVPVAHGSSRREKETNGTAPLVRWYSGHLTSRNFT